MDIGWDVLTEMDGWMVPKMMFKIGYQLFMLTKRHIEVDTDQLSNA